MSTTITYNGSTIAQVNNETKTLLTGGKWLTGNIILTDVSDGSGGGSTSSNGYILTTVAPEQTFIATTSSAISGTEHKQAQLTFTTHLEVNSHYLVTYDNSQYIIMCYLVGGDFNTLGDMTYFFSSNSPYPFSIVRLTSTQDYYIAISNNDTGEQHTIKVDKIELIDDLKLTEKVITANGTYSASTDNADGYSSVSVSVPNAISITEVANTTGTTVIVTGTEASGGTSASEHIIHFVFTDETTTDISIYYTDTFTASAITATTPRTYNNKTVTTAQLDGVTWYELTNIPLNTELIDFSKCTANTSIGDSGEEYEQEWYYVSDFTLVDPSMTFTYKVGTWTNIGLYDSNKTFVRTINVSSSGTVDQNDSNLSSGTLNGTNLPSNVAYVKLSSTGANSNYMSLIRTA